MAKRLSIVTIGGGTGSPIVLKSLVKAGLSNISAISASMDSGGKTGIIRSDERDRVIAISDLLRNLLALISQKQNHKIQVAKFTEIVGFIDGRNRNLGYTIYYALLEKHHNDFLAVQKDLESLLGIKFNGTAIPVTLESSNISFKTHAGKCFTGEHELDRQSMSTNQITKIWLEPQVKATPESILAIQNASHIIFCPGSLFGSVIANFLPRGITEALANSHAKKIVISNLVSDRNQTHEFSPLDYFKLFAKYTKTTKPFDYFVTPNLTRQEFDRRYPQISQNYASEHSHFLGWDEKELATLTKLNITPIQAPIFSITSHMNRVRHAIPPLSNILTQILQSNKN